MSRSVLLTGLLSLVTLMSSFAVASFAFARGEPPRLRPELPVAQLPKFSLPEATAVRVHNLIGAPGVERFGITSVSYNEARLLSHTRFGAFYLIPGSRGACVVGPSAASCGDPGASAQPLIGLAETAPGGDTLFGAGIVTAKTERVVVKRRDGSTVTSLPVVNGVFILDESAAVERPTGVRFVAS